MQTAHQVVVDSYCYRLVCHGPWLQLKVVYRLTLLANGSTISLTNDVCIIESGDPTGDDSSGSGDPSGDDSGGSGDPSGQDTSSQGCM